MKNTVSSIRTISRLIIGVLFVFSGFVKAIDPLGSAYKFSEYFEKWHLGSLSSTAVIFAILLAATELAMGMCLLTRVRMRFVAWLTLFFMSFFTVLTFYIAVSGNIVKDCGCFGDALILTNWQTFFKNLIAMPFVLIIFWQRKNYTPFVKSISEWSISILFFSASILISLYSLKHLPIIDFMPYKVGTNIPMAMEYPEDAEPDVYETTYTYSKDGINKEFDETNYPYNDSTWLFVDSQSQLIKQGYKPPISDLIFMEAETGEDQTDYILNSDNHIFIFTSRNIENIDISSFEKTNNIANYCSLSDKYGFIAYTASNQNEIDIFKATTNTHYNFYVGDETEIKTMIRANPGLILLHNGNILAKWAAYDIPDTQKIEEILNENPQSIIDKNAKKEKNRIFLLLAIALVVVIASNLIKSKKRA